MAEFAREPSQRHVELWTLQTAKALHSRAREDLQCHHRGSRIPRQPKEETVPGPSENQRLAGLDQNPIEKELGPERRESRLDDIVLAGRHAAGQQEEIGL